ncbi:hypothetical protein [Kitasatospora sp. SUK 42]|uniref:hypothetical protein n=1 Tax=Kitasatospora sp. SUK 42 TaxID=1588882 RepID=UPI0018C9E6B6|nr:hypothetical protein [Kitasatospora sp. SUK 42]MBV2155076.1 hypothetical protein [Kitasatospora sp. SUK 42]
MPVHGYDIASAVVLQMLNGGDGDDRRGPRARGLGPGEPVPHGVQPVLVTPSTVYGTVQVEAIVRNWPTGTLPAPWLIVVADVPARPAVAARYRLRALGGRLAGTAYLPYLPALRSAERPEDALADAAVARAAVQLRAQLEGK